MAQHLPQRAAAELRGGPYRSAGGAPSALAGALSTPELFDLLAVRLDGEKAADADLKLEFVFPDRNEKTYVTVKNGVLIHRPIAAPGLVNATLTVNRADFLGSLLAGQPMAAKVASGAARIDGDAGAFARFSGFLSPPRPDFPIVGPR